MKMLLAALCVIFAINANAKTVTNSDGKSVTIPDKIERVSPLIPAFAQIAAMLGQSDKIVTSPGQSEMFYTLFPNFKERVIIMRQANVESLLAAKTQVVFGPKGAFFNETQQRELEAAGIAVVDISAMSTIEEIKRCVELIANIFGGEAIEKAREFNAYFDRNVKLVLEGVKNAKKPTVLALNYASGSYATISDRDIGAEYIRIAGGVNVASGFIKDSAGMTAIINVEQILTWNPQIIITNSSASRDQIIADRALRSLSAVKNDKIYVVPTGAHLWSVRSAEGALQPLWLAKRLHPDLFKTLDLEKEVKSFYKRFYGYELSDAQIADILKGGSTTALR